MARCLMPGCTNEAKPKGNYCKDAHRASAHKLRVKSGGMLPRERKRLHDAAAKRVARSQGLIPSDVRLSFDRAVEVLANEIRQQRALQKERERSSGATTVAVWFATPEEEATHILSMALPKSKRPDWARNL